MTDRLPAAQALFAEALERPRGERKRFLRAACRNDGEMFELVSKLLDSHDAPEAGRFDKPAFPLRNELLAEIGLEVPNDPASIGPYQVLAKIGEGGTSTVYLARRSPGPAPEVALKVLRGLSPEEAEARVARERKAIGALDHPAITKLLDSGISEGRAYLVMDYVDGVPVTVHCDARRDTVEQRLEILVAICNAVDHAHRHMIVHRDLKPNNILIDDEGHSHLLDFGIAKLLQGAHGDETSISAARMLTPNYGAPEQFFGGAITTATDVYSLGVLLYELLTGIKPRDWRGSSPAQIAKIWEGSAPVQPSELFAGAENQEIEELAALRKATPAELSRRLRGDLDHIVSKALRFEPKSRYASVAAFVGDLRNHLAGMPVLARPATLGYRVAKLVRRHAAVSVLASLLILALAGIAVTSSVMARRLASERDLAKEQTARAEAVTDLLVGSFDAADPLSGLSTDEAAREILDRGIAMTEIELVDQPEIQATAYQVLGAISLRQGGIERARMLLERALVLREEREGRESLAAAMAISALGSAFSAAGDFDAAGKAAKEALQIRTRIAGALSPEAGLSLRQLAELEVELGDFEAAEELVARALEAHRAIPGQGREIALDLNLKMRIHFHKSDLEAAEKTGREALAASREFFPAGSTAIADDLSNLGAAIWARGRYKESAVYFREALDMHRSLLGADHPQVASDLNNLAVIHQELGEFDEALELMQSAHDSVLARLGAGHHETATIAMNFGNVLQAAGRIEQADKLLGDAKAVLRDSLGADHPKLAQVLHLQATGRFLTGDWAAAEPLLFEALEIRNTRVGESSYPACETTMMLARVRERLERWSEARRTYFEARNCFVTALDPRHYLVGLADTRLAELELRAGRNEEGERLALDGIERMGESLPDGHWRIAEGRSILGAIYLAQGRRGEAEAELRYGYRRLVEIKGENALPTRDARGRLSAGGFQPM